MTKAELESKHLSDLHSLAAEAGVERYRMLTRTELIEKLAEVGGFEAGAGESGRSAERERERPPRERPARERPPRRRRRGGTGDELGDEAFGGAREERSRPREQPRKEREERRETLPEPSPPERAPAPEPAREATQPAGEAAERPRRRRRRRRFGRRGKDEVTIQDLLLPPAAGRQAILCAPTREACTALLRGVAADLAANSKGPDPVVLLIDPGPEELADWKREAPQAEIVSAGQARHADDALAQAASRAGGGEDVILLVDSLSRLAAAFGDADSAKEFFDAGRVPGGAGGGSLTVVAALERA